MTIFRRLIPLGGAWIISCLSALSIYSSDVKNNVYSQFGNGWIG
jgi:hypothetical protein